MNSPAKQLLGRELDGGWKVVELLKRSDTATGGHFSVGYVVESKAGVRAYLKAIDIDWAFKSSDPMRALQEITQTFNFERDLCEKCKMGRLDRVVTTIADGKILVDPDNTFTVVHYLIFELADGDLRSHLDTQDKIDMLWALRCLHHVATGIAQLHKIDVAHQDIKPSNIVIFDRVVSKVTDLGRASIKGGSAPHDAAPFAGDRTYAPPEGLYGFVDPEWNRRRLGCDLYHLGSLAVFFFTRSSMTAMLIAYMNPEFRPEVWAGTYNEVLPFLRTSFMQAMKQIEGAVPLEHRDEICRTIRELCDPDPAIRGYPNESGARLSQFSLERYISQFDLLAKRLELQLTSKKK